MLFGANNFFYIWKHSLCPNRATSAGEVFEFIRHALARYSVNALPLIPPVTVEPSTPFLAFSSSNVH